VSVGDDFVDRVGLYKDNAKIPSTWVHNTVSESS